MCSLFFIEQFMNLYLKNTLKNHIIKVIFLNIYSYNKYLKICPSKFWFTDKILRLKIMTTIDSFIKTKK